VSARWVRVGGAVLVGVVAAAVVVAIGRQDSSAPPLRMPGVRVQAFIDPVAHRFADPVTAHVEALVPTGQVNPGSLRIRPQFAPYRILSRTRTQTTSRGVARIRWRFRLVCLTEGCRPPAGGARSFDFAPVQVSFRRRDGVPRVRIKDFHALRSVSRLSALDAPRERLTARPQPLPALSYRVSPERLSTVALIVAALLALLGAVLLWRTFSELVVERLLARRLSRLGPVQRQLALLRRAVARSDDEGRRRALDALSVELASNGNGTDALAVGARRLAWSSRHGSESDVLGFADDVERALQPEARR
jgi:hypothetical protein